MKRAMIIIGVILLTILFCPRSIQAQTLTAEDIYLIGSVTTAEANNQCVLGQRYVIDTILNRIEREDFPDSAHDVINAPSQYAKGRPVPTKEMIQLVIEEIDHRTNNDVLYFRTERYHGFGLPVVKIQDHYFSTKE